MKSRKVLSIVWILLFVSFASFFSSGTIMNVHSNEENSGIYPDTWTGVDGLGRVLPLNDTTGDIREDKLVGIFYWTWHDEHSKTNRARNINEIIKQYPEAIMTSTIRHGRDIRDTIIGMNPFTASIPQLMSMYSGNMQSSLQMQALTLWSLTVQTMQNPGQSHI